MGGRTDSTPVPLTSGWQGLSCVGGRGSCRCSLLLMLMNGNLSVRPMSRRTTGAEGEGASREDSDAGNAHSGRPTRQMAGPYVHACQGRWHLKQLWAPSGDIRTVLATGNEGQVEQSSFD